MKSKVYRRKVDTRNKLFHHIMDGTARIKKRQDPLRGAACHVLTQVAESTDVDGGIFENVLN
jgi:hypothetical protein